MDLITLIIVIVLLGVGLWLIETYVPMAQPVKILLRVVVILVIVLWLLRLFGITSLGIPRVGG